MGENNYIAYHLHDDTSNVNGYADSCTKYEEYVKLAKEQKMKAIAFSNHGGIYDWIKKKQCCDKNGIKYIHGVELYLCNKLSDNHRGWHIGLYAKNINGVRELNALTSIATSKGKSEDKTDRHFYFNPRISMEELMNTSNNIIITTACLASPLWKLSDRSVLEYDNGSELYKSNIEIRDNLLMWLSKNKQRCFLEIQYHNCHHQKEYNKMLENWSNKYQIPLIAGTDTHSSSVYKAECRKILQKSKNSFYGEEDEFDLTWKTYEDLVLAFKNQNTLSKEVYMAAINNTNKFADMIEEFDIDKSFKYPTLYGETADIQWKEFIVKNMEKKIKDSAINIDRFSEYKKRVNEEFDAMSKQGMSSFMLFMGELANWCVKEDIPFSPCRGSVGGSLIAYITGITDVDPLKWGTVFSRFCNADRVSLADIDMDFAPCDRKKVYQYIIKRFGLDRVSYILTLGTIKDRGSIDVLAKGLDYTDLASVKEIKNQFDAIFENYKKIIQAEVNLEELEGAESKSPDFIDHDLYIKVIRNSESVQKIIEIKRKWDKLREDNKDLFYYFDGIKGTIISKGNHPAGMIGSPITLYDNLGVIYKDGDNNFPISSCTMKAVDSVNYVKFDILGLKTIGIIHDTYKLIDKDWKFAHNINWNDKNVWNDMIKSNIGIFQFEGDYAHDLLKRFKPNAINDMSLVNASLRPSGKSYRDRLINHEFNNNPSEEIDNLLKDNKGYLVFQEDTIKFLTDICGFDGALADTTRRCLDKNTPILMSNGDYKKIKNIKVGDKVQSFNKLNISEYKTVTNVFKNGIKEAYKISTKHGYNIVGTENHKVLTQRGWIEIKDLKMTDFLMTPKIINAERDSLKPSCRLSETDMFLIGILIGDGSLTRDIHFTNSEIALIEKFKECINNRIRNKTKCEFNINVQSGVDVEYIYSVYVKSKNYKNSLKIFLEKHNLIKKAADKSIPESIMYYPKGSKLLNLLAGLFNTDGGYNTSSRMIEYYSNSKLLTYQIKSLLLKYGIYSYVDKKWVDGYNYYSYRLYIRQQESLDIFKEEIIPHMIGKKKDEFLEVINDKENRSIKYNFLLPNECKEEIIKMSELTNRSLRSVGEKLINSNKSDLGVHRCDFGISDTKARAIIEHLYCPYTYQMLFADYIPIKIKSIEEVGFREVYDIEVEDNHNYVANCLIVHNCIGKKDIKGLNEQLPKILEGYCNTSKKPRETAEKEAKEFVQIISDSSEYQFGLNHSTGYSMNGYICAMLRFYHPLEFITSYLNWAESDDDNVNGNKLAQAYNIPISPPKFRYSKAKYHPDKETNSIYKGIGSIKYCNEQIGNEMYALRDKEYNNFLELLIDLNEKTSIDSRQLEILIKLGFFSEFGGSKTLLNIVNLYNNIATKKQFKKDKLGELGIEESMIKKYAAKETPKQYTQVDTQGLVAELVTILRDEDIPIKDIFEAEMEYVGYISYKDESYNPKVCVISDINETKWGTIFVTLYKLKNGKSLTLKVDKRYYNKKPLDKYDIIMVCEIAEQFKKRKVEGKWTNTEEKEYILKSYGKVVEDDEEGNYR